eukprot:3940403-Rhodomonas_salina.2
MQPSCTSLHSRRRDEACGAVTGGGRVRSSRLEARRTLQLVKAAAASCCQRPPVNAPPSTPPKTRQPQQTTLARTPDITYYPAPQQSQDASLRTRSAPTGSRHQPARAAQPQQGERGAEREGVAGAREGAARARFGGV